MAAGGAWATLVLALYYRRIWLEPGEIIAWPATDFSSAVLPAFLVLALTVGLGLVVISALSAGPTAQRGSLLRLAALLVPVLIGGALVSSRLDGDTPLPYLGEAFRRLATGVGGFALVAGDAYVLGLLALRLTPLRFPDWPERVLFRFAAGFGVLSYASLAMAVAGVYRPRLVLALLVAVAIVGVFVATGASRRRARSTLATFVLAPGERPWMAIVGLAMALSLVGSLAPEVEYDALWYHLWLPKLWLEAGRPVDLPRDFIALYPLTFELVFGAGLAAGGTVAAKLVHWFCLPLTALAVWTFVRRFFPRVSPWLAAAIFVATPTVLWEATTAYIDLALAFYATLAVYALLRYLESERRGWLALAAGCFGMATAIKHLGLIVVALAAAGLVLSRLWRTRNAWGAFVPGVTIVAVALLFAAPWYVRAWQASGNPFFPELFKVFGAHPPERWDLAAERGLDAFKSHFGFPRTPLNLALLPWNLTMHGERFGGCVGPLFLVTLPWLLRHRLRSPAAWWLAYLVAGYVAVWSSPVSSFQLRFLMPIVPALAVLAAMAFSRVTAWIPPAHGPGRVPRRTARLALATVLFLNLPPFTPLHEGDRHGWAGWLTHVVRVVPLQVVVGRTSQDRYLHERVGTFGAWRYLEDHAPQAARVLVAGGGNEFYATRSRISIDAVVARAMHASAPADGSPGAPGGTTAILDTFARLGVSYVVMDKAWVRRFERDHLALLAPAFRTNHLLLAYEDGGALVYRIAG